MLNFKKSFSFFASIILLCFSLISEATSLRPANQWLIQESVLAYQKIKEHLTLGEAKGSVIASPSRKNPNYYYHWVRDAALVMDAIITYDQYYAQTKEHKPIQQMLTNYLTFSSKLQQSTPIAGLGEPRFHTDGSTENGKWTRPQNDSPALRAISLIHWANYLIANGKTDFVKEKMYHPTSNNLPIKKDLEYIAHHWKDPSYDLWEEVKGQHFYTLMVSRRALLEGAKLAERLADSHLANYYELQAKKIERILIKFWDSSRKHFIPTINQVAGLNYKTSQIDSAVILGLLHGDLQDGFLAWNDPKVVNTINKLLKAFSRVYLINQMKNMPGYAIGRYPEDKYNGKNFNGGNPWVICTLAFAEAMYRSAKKFEENHQSEKVKEIRHMADQLVLRIKHHAYPDGTLSEQINRNDGSMVSAENLTWNYAALISTRFAHH